MHVLVTGAAGFIGSHLADRLIADGHSVTGIDNLTTGLEQNVNEQVDFFHQDIRNIKAVMALVAAPDLVIHCAASYKDPDKWHRDADTNVLGTIDVTLAARGAICPIVYMQTALPPVSSYAISKTAGMQYIQQSGVPYLVFRLANIYGPRNLSGPIPTFWKRLTEHLHCKIVDTTRDMVYVDDLVECVMFSINHADLNGVYDVCSGTETPISHLYECVAANHFSAELPYENLPPADDEAMTSVSLEHRVPGWKAETPIAAGVAKACEWYGENPPAETFTHLRMAEVEHV